MLFWGQKWHGLLLMVCSNLFTEWAVRTCSSSWKPCSIRPVRDQSSWSFTTHMKQPEKWLKHPSIPGELPPALQSNELHISWKLVEGCGVFYLKSASRITLLGASFCCRALSEGVFLAPPPSTCSPTNRTLPQPSPEQNWRQVLVQVCFPDCGREVLFITVLNDAESELLYTCFCLN